MPYRLLMIVFSLIAFVMSLFYDCFLIDRAENPRAWAPGFALLLVGWLAVFDGVFAWLANPLLVLSWLLTAMGRVRLLSLVVSLLALGLSLSFLLHSDILTNEAGGRNKIVSYEVGYWMWVGSIAVMVVGNTVWILLPAPDQRDAHLDQ